MKFVYVLVSSEKDFYYEQALMSVTSLRMYMPLADIVILTDDRSAISFSGKRTALAGKATSVIQIPFDKNVKNADRSRLIKTSIPDYVKEDFLYIDCDTVVCCDLSDITQFPYELAGVLDGHVLLEDHIHKKYFLERDKKLGFSGTKMAGYNINGGLIFARSTPLAHDFFRKWNEVWRYSAYEKHDLHDQSALNEANYRIGLKMQQLPGEWNCQPEHGGLAFLQNAKIIHYYSSEMESSVYVPYYKLADKALQQRIKDSGYIPDDIVNMLEQPKFQFNKVHIVSDRRIVDIMQSPLIFTLADFKKHCSPVFEALEAITGGLRQLAKKIGRK
jgi:hypothetical protein